MGVMWLYSLGVSACVTVLYFIARFTLGSVSFLRLRRSVILGIAIISLLLPVMPLIGGSPHLSQSKPSVGITGSESFETRQSPPVDSVVRPVSTILPRVFFFGGWIYIAGVLAVGGYFVCGSLKLRRFMDGGIEVEGTDGRVVIVADDRFGPFSWGGRIAVPVADYTDGFDAILAHEAAHMRLRHWIDLILMALLCALVWYWPVAWMMRRELRDIHEYEADRAVIESGVDMSEYQMLLIKKTAGPRFQSLASSLNHSSLKKRITMMMSKPTKGTARLRALAMVPAVAIVAAVMCSPSMSAQVGSLLAVGGLGDKVTNSAAYGEVSEQKKEVVYEAVEENPEFPGGTQALYDYLGKTLVYPVNAATNGVQGTVTVRFIVNSEGKVSDPQILRGKDPELDAEAIRVVKSLPDFIPGKMNGKPVAVWYTLPIRFRLNTPLKEDDAQETK